MKILNQKQLNISLLLLFSACIANITISAAAKPVNPTEEYVNADGIRELKKPVAVLDPAEAFGKAFGKALDTFSYDDSSLSITEDAFKRMQKRIFHGNMLPNGDEFHRCLQATPRFAYGFRTAHKNKCIAIYDQEITKPGIDLLMADPTFAIINHKPLVQKLVRIVQANDPSTKTSLSPQNVMAAIKRVASSGKISDWQEDPSPELMADLNHETALMVEKMKTEPMLWSRCVAKLAPVEPTYKQCKCRDPLEILEKEFPAFIFAAIQRELARKKAAAQEAAQAKIETPRDAR